MSIVDQLEATGEGLSPAVRAAMAVLEATNTLLQERVHELEARLGLNSTNSSKPPSSDPPGTVRPPKKPTGKKRGGQKGHRGHHRNRVATERVNTTIPHRTPWLHIIHLIASVAALPWRGSPHRGGTSPVASGSVHRPSAKRTRSGGSLTRSLSARAPGARHPGKSR
jgi:hypothetical protein